jgi:hypothetical protein
VVIRLFEPTSNPELIPSIRPSRHNLFFRHGEQMRLCLDALREKGGLMQARNVAEYAMLMKGLPVDDKEVRTAITEQVRWGLSRLEKRGLVRRVILAPDVWWELAWQPNRLEAALRDSAQARSSVARLFWRTRARCA